MKKKKKSKSKEGPLFVSLDEETVKNSLIEASKETLRFLQYFDQMKGIREKKAAVIFSSTKNIQETRTLINKLRKLLPKQKLAGCGTTLEKKPIPQQTESKDKELEALEKELAEIEKKLNK